MRKRSLTAVLACLALSAMLLVPGSALAASDPLTIGGSGSTAVPESNCNFTANAPGENITLSALDTCLAAGNVTITDPSGADGGDGIEIDGAISSTCGGTTLTLDEEGSGGTVAVDNTVSLPCTLEIEAPSGAVTGTADITANTLDLDIGGALTLLSPGSNAIGTLEGSAVGEIQLGVSDPLEVGALSDSDGDLDITSSSTVGINGAVDISGELQVNDNTGTGVTEQDSGSINASTLSVSSGGDVTLDGSGNQFGADPNYAAVEANTGSVSLDDDVADLDLLGINAGEGDLDITNSGNIVSSSSLQAPGSTASVTSQNGSVTEASGQFWASQLTVSGTSVSLPDANDIGTLDATATTGDVDADIYIYGSGGATLGNIDASNGDVDITNSNDGPLTASGSITADSITLSADGFAATSGATLAAPSISLADEDSDASDSWTVNASTITPDASDPIAYSGASSLSISGGALFNVIPSATTAMTFAGDGGTPAGVLDYNAEGGLVSGTDTPSSGTIDNSEYEPVSYSGMATVQVSGAGTPPVTTTPTTTTTTTPPTTTTTTTTTSNAPSCTLKASSSKVTLPKRVHGKLKGKPSVTLVATCSAAVEATLVGRVTVVSKAAHGKTKSKGYGVALVHVALGANTAKKVVLDVPAAVATALAKKGDKLSAGFTMADPAHGDDVLKTVTISHLT